MHVLNVCELSIIFDLIHSVDYVTSNNYRSDNRSESYVKMDGIVLGGMRQDFIFIIEVQNECRA